jgi:hypothetical protein
VSGTRLTRAHGQLWFIHYPADGDAEEMTWQQLRAALLPPEEEEEEEEERDASRGARNDAPAPAPHAGAPPAPAATARAPAPHAPAAPHAQQPQPQPRSSGAAAPREEALPPPPRRKYKGVTLIGQLFRGGYSVHRHFEQLGMWRTAEEAARAYDDVMRALGRRVVNFPRRGTDEVQAVAHEKDALTLMRAERQRGAAGVAGAATPDVPPRARARSALNSQARSNGAAAPPRRVSAGAAAAHHDGAGAAPASTSDDGGAVGAAAARAPPPVRYCGVWRERRKSGLVVFLAELPLGNRTYASLGCFGSAEAAARVVDAEARRRGLLRRLNFPATAAEHAAVAAWMARPQVTLARNYKRHADAGDDAGGAPAPVAKRTRAHAAPAAPAPAAAPPPATPAPHAGAAAFAAAHHGGGHDRGGGAGDASDDDADADVSQLASFLRGIAPPLRNLPAVLAAARSSGITLPELLQTAAMASPSHPSFPQMALGVATSALCIDAAAGDDRSFVAALLARLAPPPPSAAAAAASTQPLPSSSASRVN